jgi:kynureninase
VTDFEAQRSRFPTLRERAYFVTHGFGPLLDDTLADLDDYRRTLPLRHRVVEPWYERIVEMRGLLARLIGAGPDDIALGPNATACQASLAASLAPTRERDVIVTTDMDFPSSRYLWHAQVRRGFRVIDIPSRDGKTMPVNELLAAIHPRVAVVAVPMVAYTNGALLDVARITHAAHEAGAIVVLDAYQAAGIVPIDVATLGVDALVSGTNKWLSSAGTGLAFLYVDPRLAERLEPALPGWFAHVDPLAFAARFVPARGARRFEIGAPAVEAIYGARAGVKFALDAGVSAIRERSLALTDRLIAMADERGLPLATPRARELRAGMVCFAVPDAERVADRLREHGVDVDTRPGTGLRMSCHPCTTFDDCERGMTALASVL